MKISSLLSLLIFLCLGGSVIGQNLAFSVTSTSDLPGTTVTLTVETTNFSGMIGFQGTISYDDNNLEFLGASSSLVGFSAQGSNGTTVPFGKATFLWNDFSLVGEDIADGGSAFQLDFLIKPTATNGTVSTVSIDGSLTPLGYVDPTFTSTQLLPITVSNGTIGVGSGFPVEMLDFQAQAQNGIAKLEWITASEEGNDYFEVQKSENGEDFFPIGTVKGAGNSQEHTYYSFDDPISATSLYYRLLQVDFDGTTSLSDVVELSVDAESQDWIQVFPNPSTNSTQIRLENWEDLDQTFRIQLFSIDGKMMMEERIEGSQLVTDYNLNVAQYPRGSYLLKVSNALGKTSQNLLILH